MRREGNLSSFLCLAAFYININNLLFNEIFAIIYIESEGRNVEYTSYFAVVHIECYNNPIYGIYPTREDAWEAIITEAETFAYDNMMCCERGDVMDSKDNEWTWDDYDYLFNDAIHAFEIQEVKMFK